MVSSLVYTPGVRLELPVANDLPGTDKPTVRVAIDRNGRLYYQNRWIGESELAGRLREAAAHSTVPLTLVVQADKAVTQEMLIRLATLGREAGIADALLATLPQVMASPSAPSAR
jgi:biopolymer transport protein ExbD